MKVLNIGSLNIDKTYQVEQFVQPKETIQALEYEEFCGGKGLNQSVALASAGACVYHAGAVGKDGKELLAMLRQAGVHTDYVNVTDGVSGHAVIQINQSGQNNIIIFGGANQMVRKEYIRSVLKQFEAGDLVLLQNEISNVDFAIEEAKKRGLTVAFNPSPMNDKVKKCRLDLVDYLIVNEIEGAQLAEIDSDEPDRIRKTLQEKFPNASFVLTLGENGSYYFDQNQTVFRDIFHVDAVDTTGAGDTFCGYFLAGLTEGRAWDDILARASAASAIAVGQKGAANSVPKKEAVEQFLAVQK